MEKLYLPLADSDEIRLLCLDHCGASEANQTITCTVKHVKLRNKPQYEALSYEWGKKDTKIIMLGGKKIQIRENLFDALVCLRYETECRVLWIDALCINQADIKERNHQVSQMASIYSKAKSVVVWIGQSDDLTDIVLNFHASMDKGSPIWKGLQALSDREYWKRLWIIQEIFFAADLRVQCGNFCVLWKDLQRLVRESGITTRRESLHIDSRMAFMVIHNQFLCRRSDLLTLSLLHREADCERVVDKLFGLWALDQQCCQQAVPVDYSLTFEDILRKVLLHGRKEHGYRGNPNAVRNDEVENVKQELLSKNRFE
ncbi:HET-domain-containing protein [Stipitochalara longipes BDJ]|nr:HET-domain-containing protein [Stipitochalara longipes BDJ]